MTATETYDTKTKLTWQRTLNASSLTFANAGPYCAGLGSGYRLPSMKELQTIVDDSRRFPCIDPAAFPSTPVDIFWSSSPVAGAPANAWDVYFSDGKTNADGVANAYRVRCVR